MLSRYVSTVMVGLLLAATAHGTSLLGTEVLPIKDAVQRVAAFAEANPADARGHYAVGMTHLTVYALGRKSVEFVRLPLTVPPIVVLSIPPNRLSRRILTLPPDRLRHLAVAVRALRRAATLAPDAQIWLSLGYAYSECRDQFLEGVWPFTEDSFDEESRRLGSDAAYWDNLALNALANLTDLPERNDWDLYNDFVPSERDLAVLLVVEILDRTCDAGENLDKCTLRESARRVRERYGTEGFQYEEPLPPLSGELASLYPLTTSGLARADTYLRAVDEATFEMGNLCEPPDLLQEWVRLDVFQGPEFVRRAERLLVANVETFRLLHTANGATPCRYPIDLSRGCSTLLPHLGRIESLSQLLALKTAYSVSLGGNGDIADTLLDSFALADSLRSEPLLSSQFTRANCFYDAFNSLKIVLGAKILNDSQLSALQHALLRSDDMVCFVDALWGECLTHEVSLLRMLNANPAHPLEGEEPMDNAARADTRERIALRRAAYARMAAATELPLAIAKLEYYESSRMVAAGALPDMSRGYEAFLNFQAQIREARLALAVERYRIANGVLPKAQEDLLPRYLGEIATDPFTNAPLQLRIETDGYSLYGVGDDLPGDGSLVNPSRQPTDVVFDVRWSK